MDELHARLSEALFSTTNRTFSRWEKIVLLLTIGSACVVAYVAFHTIDGAVRGYSASLLHHGSGVRGVVAAIVASVVAGVVGLVIAGRVRPDAAIFATAVSLLFFRLQGGAAKYTLLVADGRAGFTLMAAEVALLAGFLIAIGLCQRLLVSRMVIADDAARDGCTLSRESIDQKLLCSATVAVVTTAGMMILCQSDNPLQVVWAVFLSSLAATWCTFRFVPVAPSVWYWVGPAIAGLVGYIYAYFYGYQFAAIGEPSGVLASLARATPLDYASVGVVGSLCGYWIGRKQHRERQEQAEAEAAGGSNIVTG